METWESEYDPCDYDRVDEEIYMESMIEMMMDVESYDDYFVE